MRLSLRSALPAAVLGVTGLVTAFALVPGGHPAAPATKLAASSIPQYSHVVIVMEENHSYSDIIGNTAAPPTSTARRPAAR